jgi:hypothetical protein
MTSQEKSIPRKEKGDDVLLRCLAEMNPNHRAFIESRYGKSLEHRRKSTRFNRAAAYACRAITITGGVALPALVTAETHSHRQPWVWLSITVSILVALAGGTLQVARIDDRWRLNRDTRNRLRFEGWNFAEGRAEYVDQNARYELFVDRVHATLSEFDKQYAAKIFTGLNMDGEHQTSSTDSS